MVSLFIQQGMEGDDVGFASTLPEGITELQHFRQEGFGITARTCMSKPQAI